MLAHDSRRRLGRTKNFEVRWREHGAWLAETSQTFLCHLVSRQHSSMMRLPETCSSGMSGKSEDIFFSAAMTRSIKKRRSGVLWLPFLQLAPRSMWQPDSQAGKSAADWCLHLDLARCHDRNHSFLQQTVSGASYGGSRDPLGQVVLGVTALVCG